MRVCHCLPQGKQCNDVARRVPLAACLPVLRHSTLPSEPDKLAVPPAVLAAEPVVAELPEEAVVGE